MAMSHCVRQSGRHIKQSGRHIKMNRAVAVLTKEKPEMAIQKSKALRLAVIIPCYNEDKAIATVVKDFKRALPSAQIYVYDNNSSDNTISVARAAGALVRSETRQGKGYVVRRMFADIEADVYIMVDGDDTYEAAAAPRMVNLLVENNLDIVSGARKQASDTAYRMGHKFGNALLTGIVRTIFGKDYHDMLSGYRVFSRRFAKSFPVMSVQFEIETELTIHALELEMPFAEVETSFKDRPVGSFSKLRTFHDGFRILWTITKLLKQERPMTLFGIGGAVLGLLALVLAYPLLVTYLDTGLVPRLPTAILVTGMVITSILSLQCGLVLDSITRGRKEAKRLAYLNQPSPEAIKIQNESR